MDVVLRAARTDTALRRASLTLSCGLLLGVPLWHLHNVDAPALGPPGAVDLFGLELIDPLALLGVALAKGPSTALLWVSEQGRVRMRARVTDDVHPETVVAPFGWERANVNLLNDVRRLDPISGFPALRSIRCRLERGEP
jgi:hypothetical protein